MNEIIMDITVDIDCYGCGENLSIPFRWNAQVADYAYCAKCQEGVEIVQEAGTLSISRLEQE